MAFIRHIQEQVRLPAATDAIVTAELPLLLMISLFQACISMAACVFS